MTFTKHLRQAKMHEPSNEYNELKRDIVKRRDSMIAIGVYMLICHCHSVEPRYQMHLIVPHEGRIDPNNWDLFQYMTIYLNIQTYEGKKKGRKKGVQDRTCCATMMGYLAISSLVIPFSNKSTTCVRVHH
jgi:hypothetical protein